MVFFLVIYDSHVNSYKTKGSYVWNMKSVYLTSMATNGLTFLVSRESSKTKLRQFTPLVLLYLQILFIDLCLFEFVPHCILTVSQSAADFPVWRKETFNSIYQWKHSLIQILNHLGIEQPFYLLVKWITYKYPSISRRCIYIYIYIRNTWIHI